MKSKAAAHNRQFKRVPSKADLDTAIRAYGNGNSTLLENACKRLLVQEPCDAFATTNLGRIYYDRGDIAGAIALYRQGLTKNPNFGELHLNLASALFESGHWHEALHYAHRAVELLADSPVALLVLSAVTARLGLLGEAEQAARRAISMAPDEPKAWNNLASILREQGRPTEATAVLHKIVAAFPGEPHFYTNLLLNQQYDNTIRIQDVIATTSQFQACFESPLVSSWPCHGNTADPWRVLRIGLLTPDFMNHSVMYFVEPLLARLDRSQYDIICYHTYPAETGDHVTERVKQMSTRFVCLGGRTPREQARMISNDAIDILIDLAGHTANNGLLAMAHKPAPVQITWLGYPGTTGLTAIDWRITDPVADAVPPAGSDTPALNEQYSEKLAFLPPPFCVYRPCISNPLQRYWAMYQVSTAPALANGYITFGSCNNLAKLSTQVLAVWGKLLQKVPTARLLIEGKGFDNQEVAGGYREKCGSLGIDLQRLELLPLDSANQYLTYHRIDIALDPFPLTGGTTSFDLLWMGLPLITMQGASFRSRMSMSLLTAAGLTEWIARDEDEYIEIAAKLASDIPALNARRLQQRQRIEASPLMDEVRFTRLFEEALRQMWLKWCAEQVATGNPGGQFQQWLQERPQLLPTELQIFLKPGERIGLEEARKRLQQAVDDATKFKGMVNGSLASVWYLGIQIATRILESIPKEPMALAALAEAEYAHGNLRAAISYLSHAIEAAPHNQPFYSRLIHWHREAGNEQAAQMITRLMQQRRTGV